MTVPLSEEAYVDFREKCIENWYIELLDDSDTPLIRLNVTDPRVERTSVAGANPVTLRITVTGADMPSLPTTIAKAALYRVATGGTAVAPAGAIAGALLALAADQVAVTAIIYQPEVVA